MYEKRQFSWIPFFLTGPRHIICVKIDEEKNWNLSVNFWEFHKKPLKNLTQHGKNGRRNSPCSYIFLRALSEVFFFHFWYDYKKMWKDILLKMTKLRKYVKKESGNFTHRFTKSCQSGWIKSRQIIDDLWIFHQMT